MNRKAVIDIGSNSIKFFAGEKDNAGSLKTILDTLAVTRLGEGLDRLGIIPDYVMERNVSAIEKFCKTADKLQVSEIAAVGTMALRSAKNSSEFTKRVKKACGLDVKIITGDQEAYLSYLGAASALQTDGDILLFDNGGGSTEFIFGDIYHIKEKFSINLGAVRITEKYFDSLLPSPSHIKEALLEIRRELLRLSNVSIPAFIAGIGGTVTSMAAIKQKLDTYEMDAVEGSILTKSDVKEQLELLFGKTPDERKSIPGLSPERAYVILGGSLIIYSIMDVFDIKKITVSSRGLRHGLMSQLFEKDKQGD